MISRNILSRYFVKVIYFFVSVLILTSCVDEWNSLFSHDIEEGIPTSCRINFDVPKAIRVTRADMSEGMDTDIRSLWIGLFKDEETDTISAGDGTDTSAKLAYQFTYGDQEKGAYHVDHFIEINNITTGYYHIVAVANPDVNYGVNNKNTTPQKTLLSDLLKNVKTINDLMNIVVVRSMPGSILVPANPLPMLGVYVGADEDDPSSNDIIGQINKTVGIDINNTSSSSNNTLDGSIHFRRMISQIKFNVTCDKTYINPESFEVEQVRVFNVPTSTWMVDRNSGHTNAILNSGDEVPYPKADIASRYLEATSIFHTSDMDRTITDAIPVYSFDWWQMENRRTAINACSSYGQREEEYKNSNGSNTGVYKALSNGVSDISNANFATYAEIRVRMTMTDAKKTLGYSEAQTALNNHFTEGYSETEIDAVYTVHLGYIDNNADDFNCLRNHIYTYNIKVQDANSIVVEAICEEENQTGQEGIATFVTKGIFETDAHYSVFNIELSNDERKDLVWLMRVYDKTGNCLDLSNAPGSKTYLTEATSENKLYWNWIELRPTSGEKVIADYKPSEKSSYYKSSVYSDTELKTFSIFDIRNVSQYPGYNKNTSTTDTTKQWYTVFVNEYVYESNDTTVTWKKFVNMPVRNLWLKVTEWRSSDNESSVIYSKYAIKQKSIQSFYNDGTVVFGAEHENETVFDKISDDNNNKLYQNGGSGAGTIWEKNSSVLRNDDNTFKKWVELINPNKIQNSYTVPELLNTGSLTMHRACLNRNRDLNGDGTIDKDEIRWILPDASTYTKMAVGADGMISKLFDPKTGITKDKKYYHYAMIEGNMFWAEEGYSTGWMGDGKGGWPAQVKCVRILGSYDDIEKVAIDDAFEIVDNKNENNRLCYIKFHFNNSAYREVTNAPLPAHMLGSDYNRPVHKIQYYCNRWGRVDTIGRRVKDWIFAFRDDQIEAIENDVQKRWNILGYPSNTWSSLVTCAKWFWCLDVINPCAKLNTASESGWRIPNQTETAALSLSHCFPDGGGDYYPSCTANNAYYYLFDSSRTKYYREPLGAVANTQISSVNNTYINNSWFICVRDVE